MSGEENKKMKDLLVAIKGRFRTCGSLVDLRECTWAGLFLTLNNSQESLSSPALGTVGITMKVNLKLAE